MYWSQPLVQDKTVVVSLMHMVAALSHSHVSPVVAAAFTRCARKDDIFRFLGFCYNSQDFYSGLKDVLFSQILVIGLYHT